MRIKIGSLKGKPGTSLEVEKDIDGEFIEGTPEIEMVNSPLRVKLTVNNVGDGLLVEGQLGIDVEYICTRCLSQFAGELKTDIEEKFYFTETSETEDDEGDFFPEAGPVVHGDELNLTDSIKESLLLAIPMKVVCDESCSGLCSQCGKPLDSDECNCTSQDMDIRFAPLLDLLNPEERRKENGSTKKETFKGKN